MNKSEVTGKVHMGLNVFKGFKLPPLSPLVYSWYAFKLLLQLNAFSLLGSR